MQKFVQLKDKVINLNWVIYFEKRPEQISFKHQNGHLASYLADSEHQANKLYQDLLYFLHSKETLLVLGA
jgi:hypothetical protein